MMPYSERTDEMSEEEADVFFDIFNKLHRLNFEQVKKIQEFINQLLEESRQ